MKLISVLVAAVLVCGCEEKKPVVKVPVLPKGSVTVADPQIQPLVDYYRRYAVQLYGDRKLEVKSISRPWLSYSPLDPSFVDTLYQSDGRSVEFDCDHIAEKIIDTSLVKEITPLCPALHKMAKDYWQSVDGEPDEYVGRNGQHWKRVR